MSTWIVELQEEMSAYPPWVVIGGGLLVLALVAWILSKFLKILAAVLIVGVIAGACYLAFETFVQPAPERPEPPPPANTIPKLPPPRPEPTPAPGH